MGKVLLNLGLLAVNGSLVAFWWLLPNETWPLWFNNFMVACHGVLAALSMYGVFYRARQLFARRREGG